MARVESATTEQPTAEQVRAARERRRTWHGYLAKDNAGHIRDRIERMLSGRRFAFVDTNAELRTIPPKVRTSQRLAKPPYLASPGHVIVVDFEYVWGVYSEYSTEAEARKAADAGAQDVTYLLIEGDGEGNRDRIEVQSYNWCRPRELLHWVIVPEHPEWDEAVATDG